MIVITVSLRLWKTIASSVNKTRSILLKKRLRALIGAKNPTIGKAQKKNVVNFLRTNFHKKKSQKMWGSVFSFSWFIDKAGETYLPGFLIDPNFYFCLSIVIFWQFWVNSSHSNRSNSISVHCFFKLFHTGFWVVFLTCLNLNCWGKKIKIYIICSWIFMPMSVSRK